LQNKNCALICLSFNSINLTRDH